VAADGRDAIERQVRQSHGSILSLYGEVMNLRADVADLHGRIPALEPKQGG